MSKSDWEQYVKQWQLKHRIKAMERLLPQLRKELSECQRAKR